MLHVITQLSSLSVDFNLDQLDQKLIIDLNFVCQC